MRILQKMGATLTCLHYRRVFLLLFNISAINQVTCCSGKDSMGFSSPICMLIAYLMRLYLKSMMGEKIYDGRTFKTI